MLRKMSVFVLVFLALAAATPALAQSQTVPGLKLSFVPKAPVATVNAPALKPIKFAASPMTPAFRRGSTMSWRPMVIVGLNAFDGIGFAAGGGVQASNLAGDERFGLQIDGYWSNAGGNDFFDDDFGDFSASQIGISGAFLFWFKEMSSGWRPFAGGGIVYARFSYDYDFDDDFCFDPIFGDLCDFDTSASGMGLQFQGGVAKGNIQLEGRVQNTVGGAFLFLFGYKFGGGS